MTMTNLARKKESGPMKITPATMTLARTLPRMMTRKSPAALDRNLGASTTTTATVGAGLEPAPEPVPFPSLAKANTGASRSDRGLFGPERVLLST